MKYASVCSGVEAASLAWLPLGWEAAWFSEIEKFPCEVLKYRFPNVPNLGDMTKIKVEDTEDGQLFTNGDGAAVAVPGGVDLLVGGTPCFAAGEMVLTDKGYVPIERINVGDMVVSHKGRLCPVTATGHKADRIGELKVVGRPMIHCTGNHPFYTVPVRRDCRRKSGTYSNLIPDGEYRFTPASESGEMYAGRLPVLEKSCVPVRPEGMTDTEIVLAGWYVGDGYIRRFTGKNKKTVIIAAVSNDKVRKFRRLFQDKISFSVSEDGKITINCTRLAELFSNEFGELSHNKRIPFWVYGDKERELFLSGYTATDGCLGDNGNLRYSTVSTSLAYGVADILQNASVSFMVTDDTHVIEGRTVNQRNVFEVEKYKKARKTKLIGDRYASRIKEFRAGSAGIVFNITVGGDHSYIVNGLAVHNCQGFSVAGKQGGLKDERSGLAMCYVNLLRAMHPTWFVWENVPGVFSTAGGEDIRTFLRAIDDIGYSLSWRVLDGQYCRVDGFPGAVPQRRRRVFAVGHLGADWRYSASVLLEPDFMPRNNPPVRKTWQAVAGNIGRCASETGRGFYRMSSSGQTLEAHEDRHRRNLVLDGLDVLKELKEPHRSGFSMQAIGEYKNTGASSTLKERDYKDADECSLTLATVNDQALIQNITGDHGNRVTDYTPVVCYDCQTRARNPQETGQVSCTLQAAMGKGGNNTPIIISGSPNVDGLVMDDQGGKNINIHHDISPTLRAETHNHLPNVMCYAMQGNGGENISPTITGDHASRPTDLCPVLVTQKVFSLDAKSSNSMKSSNPYSGCHESDVAKTLDINPPAPECNQGGQVVVAPVDLRDAMRDPEKMDTGLNRQGTGIGDIDAPANTLSCGPVPGCIQCEAAGFCGRQGSLAGGIGYEEEVSPTLRSCMTSDVMHQSSVRRLTPLECERLMGFPDYWTMIPVKLYKSKPTSSRFEKYRDLFFETEDGSWVEMAPDGPRYKACGNSMCVNVMRWIGMRIELTERKMNGEVR